MKMLAFDFPSGRYHATPWGRHVNEGAVEWPPSPWRLLRALMATGFARLGWGDEVPEAARVLLGKLAERLPVYGVPRHVGSGHTRHYMPDYAGKRDRVLDAWAYVGRDGCRLAVRWDVALSEPEGLLLQDLVGALPYLGRAESWALGKVVAHWPEGMVECVPGETPPASRGFERVTLLAPMPEGMYADFRATMEAQAARPPAKGSGRGRRKKGLELPASAVDALLQTTSDLQAAGWSQPPGSRFVTYWRPDDALVARPEMGRTSGRACVEADTALLAVSSDTRQAERYPRMRDALWRCELLHAALVSQSAKADRSAEPVRPGRPAPSLRGRDGARRPLEGHRHAYVLPLDLDAGRLPREARPGERWIDHFLVHARMGLEPNAQLALHRVKRTWAKDLPDLFLTLVGLGKRPDFEAMVPALRAAVDWESVTPFVPPRHLKPRGSNTLEGQVRAEIASRGLPEPTQILLEVESPAGSAWVPADLFGPLWACQRGRRVEGVSPETADLRLSPRWRHFRRARRDESKAPPIALGVGLRLTFAEPVEGPVALGYGSHLGLGLMEPMNAARGGR